MLEQPLEDFHSLAEPREFFWGQAVEVRGKVVDAQLASFLQQARAFGGGANVHPAGVMSIGRHADQAAADQAGDDAAHGGWFDLLGGGQFAQRLAAAENQHRKRGKTCRALASGCVLLAHAPQQMDGGGMQAVRDSENFKVRLWRVAGVIVDC